MNSKLKSISTIDGEIKDLNQHEMMILDNMTLCNLNILGWSIQNLSQRPNSERHSCLYWWPNSIDLQKILKLVSIETLTSFDMDINPSIPKLIIKTLRDQKIQELDI